MNLKLFWTYSAENDLNALNTLQKKKVFCEERLIDDLLFSVSSLCVHPLQGKASFTIERNQVRSIVEFPLRILYVIQKKTIFILRIIHIDQVVNYDVFILDDYFVEENYLINSFTNKMVKASI